ncbi:MAG: sulfate transporter CysZ [Pseudomonadaceae bacterium]|nr:sulfate transporter CysZ [Pseudomonadaceae bacterium]
MTAASSFTHGIRCFFDGVTLLKRRELISVLWLPLAISATCVGVGTWITLDAITDLAGWAVAKLPEWAGFVGDVLSVLLTIVTVLIGTWLLAFLALIIASPFMGLLSARVERIVTGTAPDADAGWLTSIAEALARELRKLAYHLPRALLVFLIGLVPVINLAAPALWLAFGAWIMAVQFTDYAGENRRLPFRATLLELRSQRPAALGFGLCATLAMAIPLLNVVAIAAAVVGGTILRLENHAEDQQEV